MTHSDDDGFVLPPRLAPQHVVIMPIFRTRRREGARARVLPQGGGGAARAALRRCGPCACSSTSATCAAATRSGSGCARACRCGSRSGRATWRRTPCSSARRDRAPKDKQSVPRAEFVAHDRRDADSRSRTACSRARKAFREEHTRRIDTSDEFYAYFTSEREEEGKPDADPRRLRAHALRRRRRAREEDQGRPVASRCAASRSRRASPARARSRASRARSASSGRRRTEKTARLAFLLPIQQMSPSKTVEGLAGGGFGQGLGSHDRGPRRHARPVGLRVLCRAGVFPPDALLLQLMGAPRARRSGQGNLRTMTGAGGAGFWQTSAHGRTFGVPRARGRRARCRSGCGGALLWVAAGRNGDAVAQAVGAGGDQALRYDTEYPTMHYATAQRSDPVTKLQARLARGEVEARGWPARLPRLAARRATDRSVVPDARVLADEPAEPANPTRDAARDLLQRRGLRRVGAAGPARDRLDGPEPRAGVLHAGAAGIFDRRSAATLRRSCAEVRARAHALPELPRFLLALG